MGRLCIAVLLVVALLTGNNLAGCASSADDTAEWHVKQGNESFNQGHFDEAIKNYDEAIRLNPEFADAYYFRGIAYFDFGQFKRAIQDLDEVIRLVPNHAWAYCDRGLAYQMLDKKAEAIADFEKCLTLTNDAQLTEIIKKQIEALALAPTPAPALEQVYSNPVYGWFIQFPDDWVLDSTDPAYVKIQPSVSGYALVGILSGTVRFTSLDEFVDFTLAHNKTYLEEQGKTLVVLSRRHMTLANDISAIEVVAEIGLGGKSRRLYVLVDKQAFVIDAETHIEKWDTFHPYFDAMIDSFTVPKLEQAPAPQPAPSPPPAPSPQNLIYEDDFSSTKSGWAETSGVASETYYAEGEYHLLVKTFDWSDWEWNTRAGRFTDFVLEIDARLVNGQKNVHYGLVFRLEDNNDFYRFLVGGDGFYRVGTKTAGMWTTLAKGTRSAVIKGGSDTNRLKVVCAGPQIKVYVNGHHLTTVTDDSYTEGYVGMIVYGPEPDSHIAFDNLRIYAIE